MVAATCLLVSACGGGNGSDSSADASSTGEQPTTTEGGVCPDITLPSGSTSAPVNADVDGDALDDLTYVVDNAMLVVELGGGGAVAVELVEAGGPSEVRSLGGADLVADGTEEIAVVTGGGAYSSEVGFVRFRDCELFELAFEDSSPARFLSGASVSNGESLFCRGDGTVERYFWSIVDGEADDPEFEGGFEPFNIEGDVFVAYPGDGAVITAAEVAAIELFDCLGLVL